MEEVIARRHIIQERVCYFTLFAGVMGFVFGVLFLAVKTFNLLGAPEDKLWLFIVVACIEFFAGAFCIVWGIICLKKAKLPPEIIVLKGNKLNFANGYYCDIKDIVDVACKVSRLDPTGIGSLQVLLRDRVLKYRNVENAAEACQRLTELMHHSG